MKKLLAIVVLGLLWCNVLFANELQSLLKDNYVLKTTNLSAKGDHLIYTLTRTSRGEDTIKTCIYNLIFEVLQGCFDPSLAPSLKK